MHPDDRSARAAKLDPARGRLAPSKIAHVVRRTARYQELRAWYETVLGARVVHADAQLAFLSYDDEHHRIAIANLPGIPEQPPL
jgi:catechol-2,3-dioxygenase